jgi:hypothetical protein
MAKTYVSVLKKNAVINVNFTNEDITRLHAILLRHLDNQNQLDDKSYDTINGLCSKIEDAARKQNQTENKEVNF